MSDDLIKRYNLDEDDFWTLRGNKIISFDGVIKIIDAEGIKFEMSDNLDVSPSVAIKVRAYIEPNDMNELHETIEEITFGEANDLIVKPVFLGQWQKREEKSEPYLKFLVCTKE